MKICFPYVLYNLRGLGLWFMQDFPLNIATGAVVAVPWEWELDWNWVVFATDLQHMHS